jgi:putative phosphoesterase
VLVKVVLMKIGIMSDTHDNLMAIDAAVRRFNEENVKLVLHAGDYVSPFVIPRFKPLKAKMIGVFGNNDGDHEFLRARFKENPNLEIRGSFAKIEVSGVKIALLHGNDQELVNSLADLSAFDVIVHGHAHTSEIKRRNRILTINPGEVCGYLTGKSTVAFLDVENRTASISTLFSTRQG